MKKNFKRIVALALVIMTVVVLVPAYGVSANEYSISKNADASTMDGWKSYFGTDYGSTANAGGIWLDKSVLTDASAFPQNTVTLKDENGALVALSAIAANKTIVGYDNVPTDTIFVLDVSSSMRQSLEELVDAANASIKTLFELNTENRIGVILYSGYWGIGASDTETANVLLTVDRYTSWNAEGDFLYYEFEEAGDANNIMDDDIRVRVADGVTSSAGETVSTDLGRNYGGSTYIQNAMFKAYQTFDAVESTVVESGLQKGEKRIPVMVFMSDGAPTSATTDYDNVGTSNVSNGRDISGEVTDVAFLTQLTAAFVRGKIEQKYEKEMLFYTLGGFGTGESEYAKSVLNPKGVTEELWNSYVSANGANITLYVPTTDKVNDDGSLNWYSPSIHTGNQICIDNQNYADGYYLAENVGDFLENFKNIIESINIQTKYYPTEIEGADANSSGYVSFEDKIGKYVKVTDVKGILFGENLFNGAAFASFLNDSSSGLGTIENATELGDKVIQAVRSRIGVDLETARTLFDNAYNDGQLSYTSATEFSNYIGWYADENGDYCGYWAEGKTEAPASAKYVNRSYCYLGETGDSDMLFMIVLVSEEIATGDQTVIWKIPAALVPVVQYKVVLEGEDLETTDNITLEVIEAEPIRFVFEVGIDGAITEETIKELMADAEDKYITEGGYCYYTNLWSSDASGDVYSDVAAKAHFEPSADNERYYFASDADLYYLDNGNYVRIDWWNDSYFDPNGTFYAARTVFEFTEDADDGNAAVAKTVYEPISKVAFDAKVKGDDGYWYIPKGTVRFIGENEQMNKSENISGTLEYAVIPHVDELDGRYEAGALLGNNLRIDVSVPDDESSEPESSEPESSEPDVTDPDLSDPDAGVSEGEESEESEEPVVPGDSSNMLVWLVIIAVSVMAVVSAARSIANERRDF